MSRAKTCAEVCRLATPHFALLLALVVYVILGATLFHVIEHSHGVKSRQVKRDEIRNFIDRSSSDLRYDCDARGSYSASMWDEKFRKLAAELLTLWDNIDPGTGLTTYGLFNGTASKQAQPEPWSFGSALLFAFTVVTTIGFGNVFPATTVGRLVCIAYGIVGIPLTLITIANLGKFIAAAICYFSEACRWPNLCWIFCWRFQNKRWGGHPRAVTEDSFQSLLIVLILLVLYLIFGAFCFTLWKHINFFSALYFTFMTIFTVGLGPIVPDHQFLFAAILYVIFGLAILSLVIGMTAIILRKIHYGSSVPDSAQACPVWIGGRELTIGDIAVAVGKYAGLEQPELEQVLGDMDKIMANAIAEKDGQPFDDIALEFRPREGLTVFSVAEDSIPYMDDKSMASFRLL